MVIRRGNEYGEGYEHESVVLKMQVLVNRPQLRSESRASARPGREREELGGLGGVSRLTPITDASPRTTPEKSRIAEVTGMPRIPESTIRLVSEDEGNARIERMQRRRASGKRSGSGSGRE